MMGWRPAFSEGRSGWSGRRDRAGFMRVGLLTGGGDCRSERGDPRGRSVHANEGGSSVGILEGWRGLIKNMTVERASMTDDIVGAVARSRRAADQSVQNPETDLPDVLENPGTGARYPDRDRRRRHAQRGLRL